MSNVGTVPYEDDPDHMIIWLDMHIGDPNEYQHLKTSFASTLDPKNETPAKLIDRDYDTILHEEGPRHVMFEGVRFLLAAFANVERCIECFERNQHKRILFITSGSMGKLAVPRILERFRHTFTDPVTDESYMSMYVFCHNIEYQMHWALEFSDYIQIFNHEVDLLVRMLRDIAEYYVIQGKRLFDEDPPNNAAAKHRLSWAYELYQRYSTMKKVSMRKELHELYGLLEEIDEELISSSDEHD
jgi:hypothetical protein